MLNKKMDEATLAKMSPSAQLDYFGTQHYPFDGEKFEEAIKLLESQDKEFPTDIIRNGFSEDDFPENYYDLFDIYHEPAFDFELFRIAKLAITEKPTTVKINGNVSYEEFDDEEHLFIHGDLYVDGNLILHTPLFVTGNLIVNGLLSADMEWTPFLVGGNIEAKGMDIGGQVYCAGSVKTDCICIDGTGKLFTRNGLTAKLVIEEGYEHEIEGEVKIESRIDFRENDNPETGIQVLKKVLKSEVFEPIENEWKIRGEDFYFPKRLVIDVIENGDDILIK